MIRILGAKGFIIGSYL